MPKNMNEERKYEVFSDYVHGSAVRKANTVTVPKHELERRRKEEKRKQAHKRAASRNKEKALHMSPLYVMLLTGCCVAMLMTSLQYIRLHDAVASKKRSVAALELSVERLKAENDAVSYTINSFVDVDYVSKVATEQLGMVRAGEGQISYYNNTETEYMKQFKNVPEE